MSTVKTLNLNLGTIDADVLTIQVTLTANGAAATADSPEIRDILRRLKTYGNAEAVMIVYDGLREIGYGPHVANSTDPEKRPLYVRWAGLGFQNTASLEINKGAARGHETALLAVPGAYRRDDSGAIFLPTKTPDQARAAVDAAHRLAG